MKLWGRVRKACGDMGKTYEGELMMSLVEGGVAEKVVTNAGGTEESGWNDSGSRRLGAH